MFPFVVDHRHTVEPSLALYRATKSAFKSNTRGRSTGTSTSNDSSSSSPTDSPTRPGPPSAITNVSRPSKNTSSSPLSSANSFRNPYSFTDNYSYANSPSKPASSSRSASSLSSSSSTSLMKSRLAAINATYDDEYGSWNGMETAEEIRAAQQSSARALKDLEAGVPAHPRSATKGGRSSASSSSSSNSSSDERGSLVRKPRCRLIRRIFRRRTGGSEDQEMLVDIGQGH